LRGGRARQRQHIGGKLLLAAVNALLDDLGVVGLGIQPGLDSFWSNRQASWKCAAAERGLASSDSENASTAPA
jgi:hypothetical protein